MNGFGHAAARHGSAAAQQAGLFAGAAPPEQGVLAPPKRRSGLGRIASGVGSALGNIFAGQADSNLTDEQNARARNMALIQSGLHTILSGGPGLQGIAAGALAGQQAGGQARQGMAMQQAMQNPAMGLTPQQQAMLAALPPEQQAEVLSKLAQAQGEGPKVVGQGAALVGPDGRVIYESAPKGPELPGELRGLATLMGMDPAALDQLSPEAREELLEKWDKHRRAGAMNVNVGIDRQREQQEQRGLTELELEQVQEIDQQARVAEGRLYTLNVMDSLLDEGMRQGRLADTLRPLREFATSFGLEDAETLGREQLFRGLANRFAVALKEPGWRVSSDRDIALLLQMAPNLANTAEGNRLIIEVFRRYEQARINLADEMDRYIEQTGSTRGWRTHRREWLRRNPIDTSDLSGRIQTATGAAPWETGR